MRRTPGENTHTNSNNIVQSHYLRTHGYVPTTGSSGIGLKQILSPETNLCG